MASSGSPEGLSFSVIDRQARQTITITSILLALVTITLSLRLYVRFRFTRSWGLDDTLLLVSYVLYVALCTISIYATRLLMRNGFGTEILKLIALVLAGDATYQGQQIVLKWALASFVIYFVKKPWLVWTIRGSLAVYTAFSVVFWFFLLFECGPPHPINLLEEKNCYSWEHVLAPMSYTSGALNALMDWILTIAPIYVVAHLNMSFRDKVTVACLFLLGALGSIASIIRLFYLRGLYFIIDFDPQNVLKYQPVEVASIAESGIGIIGLSLVSLRPLFVYLSNRVRTLVSRNSNARADSIEAPLEPTANEQAWKKEPIVEESIDLPIMGATNTAYPAHAKEISLGPQRFSIGGTPLSGRQHYATV